MKIFYTLLFLLFSANILFAHQLKESLPIVFDRISLKEGLSNSYVKCIYQDREGFIWIGTRKGLNVYDGCRFTKYLSDPNNPNSLPGNRIRGIVEDPDSAGVFWIGTDKGLSRFNWRKNLFTNYFDTVENEDKNISCLFVDSFGSLWIGMDVDGLKKIDTAGRNFIEFRFDPVNSSGLCSNRIKDIAEDDEGNIWIATSAGLNKYDIATEEFKRFFHNPSDVTSISHNNITTICRGKNGILWVGTYSGVLNKLHIKTGKFTRYGSPSITQALNQNYIINTLYQDHLGSLWIGRTRFGIENFDPVTETSTFFKNNKFDRFSLGNNNVNTFFEDKTGVMWVGTLGSGLNKFKIQQKAFKNFRFLTQYAKELDRSRVFSIIEDQDSLLWIGYIHGGLLRFDRNGNTVEYFYKDPIDPQKTIIKKISYLHEDSYGNFWIASVTDGLYLFNRNTKLFSKPSQKFQVLKTMEDYRLWKIYEDQDKDLWFATTGKGIFHFDLKKNDLHHYLFANTPGQEKKWNFTLNIIQDSEGIIWAGTKTGILKINKIKKEFVSNYTSIDGRKKTLLKSAVCFYEQNDSIMWIGTNGNGLYKFNHKLNTARKFDPTNGFPSRFIYGILNDEHGNLWISTRKGLVNLNPNTGVFFEYGIPDGLADINFNHNAFFKSKSGELFFGHHSGITSFLPKEIEYGNEAPNIVITDFRESSDEFLLQEVQENGRFITKPVSCEYPYGDRVFYLEFAALDYTDASKNQFAYRVDGLQNEWLHIGHRNYLTLLNLPSDIYNIHIKGSSSRGIWNEEGITLQLIIHPPYWQTWWFRLLAILAAIAIGYLIYFIRTKQIKHRNIELEKINTQLNEQISVRKLIENLLRESEEKYRTLVGSIDYDIFTCDEKGRVLFVNDTMARHLSGIADEFVGKPLNRLLPEKEAVFHLQKMQQVLSSGEGQNYEAEPEINGKSYHFYVSVRPLKGKDSDTKMTLTIAANRTDQKNLEEQLRQSQKMEAIGKLAGGIAHDFNNLIAIILGYSDLLLSDIDQKSEIYENIKEIDKAGERAAVLVRQLLAFSRRQILQPTILDLNDLIRGMEKMLGRLIREDIEMWFRLDQDLVNIFADPGQIEQVLMNLIVNAKDAMPDGGTLTLETKNIVVENKNEEHKFIKKGKYAQIKISDSGAGIPEKLKAKVFDPFFTTKDKGKGTGLGLSTVFGIVKQSKGYVTYESSKGKGTTFFVYLPESKMTIKTKHAPVKLRRKLHGSETILVVEDEAGLRTMICKMLDQNGYKTLQAGDGIEALEVHAEYNGHIDLLLVDVVMPGMSGRELAVRLKESRNDLAIIYMSGYTDDDIVHKGVLFPGMHFIQKPFTPQELGEKIREALKKQKSRLKQV